MSEQARVEQRWHESGDSAWCIIAGRMIYPFYSKGAAERGAKRDYLGDYIANADYTLTAQPVPPIEPEGSYKPLTPLCCPHGVGHCVCRICNGFEYPPISLPEPTYKPLSAEEALCQLKLIDPGYTHVQHAEVWPKVHPYTPHMFWAFGDGETLTGYSSESFADLVIQVRTAYDEAKEGK